MSRTLASLYPDWQQHAARIRDAIAGLSDEQLALRAGPQHGQIWQLVAHVAGTRVYWLCGVFGQPGADRTPWTHPLTDEGWEDDEAHPRSAVELVSVLDASWEIIRGALERWPVDELELTAKREINGMTQVHSRASVLNRLFSHDAFHAGEVSQLLGLHHIGAIDLWARRS